MTDESNDLRARAGIDTTDFKSGIAAMNRDLRVLESSFKATAAGMADWSKTEGGLEARIKTLSSEIGIQTTKVEAVRAEYVRLAAEQGANSRAAQDMEIKLNNETARLNAMTLELQGTQASLEEMAVGSAEAGRGVDYLGDQSAQTTVELGLMDAAALVLAGTIRGVTVAASTLATVLKTELAVALGVVKFGASLIFGLGAAAGVAGLVIGGLTLSAGKAADELAEMAVRTGISVERLQELNFIGKVVGTDLDSVATANARLIRSMGAAQTGTSAQAKAFRELGIAVVDSQGNLRDSNVVFAETLAALGNVTNETEANVLAQQIFGRNALELNPLIKLGADGLADLTEQAHRFGAVVDDQTVQTLGDLNDQFDELKLGIQGTGSSILVAFAPFFGGLLGQALDDLAELVQIVKGSGGDFNKLAEGLSGLFQKVITDFAAQAPQFIQFGLGIIKSLVTAIINALPQLLEAGLAIVHQLVVFIIDNMPLLAQVATELLTTVADALLGQLPIIVNVALRVIETLIDALVSAAPTLLPQLAQTGLNIIRRILTAIQTVFPQLLPIAVELIQTLITFLTQNLIMLVQVGLPLLEQLVAAILQQLPTLVEAALEILTALANGLAENVPLLFPVIAEVLNQIAEILFENTPALVEAGGKLLIAIIDGLTAALPILLSPAGQNTINALIEALTNVAAQLLPELGRALLDFVIFGVAAAIPVFAESFRSSMFGQFAQFIVDARAKVLEIGKAIVEGIWQGILDERAVFLARIKQFILDIKTTIQEAIEGHSPARAFFPIGRSIADGIGVGFGEGFENLRRQMAGAVKGLSPAFAGSGGVSNVSNSNESFAFYAPVVIQDTTADGLGATLKARRY